MTTRLKKTDANAGRLVGVFGLRGELKLAATRIGNDALRNGLEVHAALADGTERALRVRTVRIHQGRPLVSFEGVEDATAAQALAGAELSIARDDAPLARDEYFDDDLVGCALVDESGRELGDVTAVEHYPAQDMLRVGSAMVPMVREFIREVDVQRRRITVTLPEGLLEGTPEEA